LARLASFLVLPSYKTGFSDKLSLGDPIAAAGKYKSKFKASELENDFQVDVEGISDGNLARLASFLVACRTLNLLRLE
jgi:hypothetical protein